MMQRPGYSTMRSMTASSETRSGARWIPIICSRRTPSIGRCPSPAGRRPSAAGQAERNHRAAGRSNRDGLRHRLAQRGDLQMVLMVADGVGDEARGDRRAVIVQDRHQPHRIDAVLVDDQLPQLGVAVLLDHIYKIMVSNEACDARMEREGADA